MSFVEAALAEWSSVLGETNVIRDEGVLRSAEKATFATAARIPAIIRPGSTRDVQASVEIAQRHGVPIYPVSRGQNWGYGSKVPSSDGAVLMELGRMNRIVDFSEELAYVTIQPGVTFGQLHDFLQAKNSSLMLTVGGNPDEASPLGNALERGLGGGPHADRFAQVAALEVVLPTGEVVRTGHARFDGARTTRLHRWGVGPSWDGLFSQSSLGVVTELTLWLLRLSERGANVQLFSAALDDDDALVSSIEGLRELLLDGTRLGFGFWNDYKTLANLMQYPWELAQGVTPMPPVLLNALKKQFGIHRWQLWGAIYGSCKEVRDAERKHVERVLGKRLRKLVFYRTQGKKTAGRPAPLGFASLRGSLARSPGEPGFGTLWHGVPASTREWNQVYWRKKTPRPSAERDPNRDSCGILWCAPCVPLVGRDVREVVEIAEKIVLAHGLEPNICIIHASDRIVDIVPAIIYDRELDGEDERAMAAHDELLEALCSRGFIPYRLGIQSMTKLPAASDASRILWRRVKDALDPRHVLAPGRYAP